VGQLASHYLSESLDAVEEEILLISVQLSQQLPAEAGIRAFDSTAQRLFQENSSRFPRMAGLFLTPKVGGGFEIVRRVDPQGMLAALDRLPADKWLADKQFFHDRFQQGPTTYFIAIQALPRWNHSALALLVPLDSHIQNLIEKERSVYAELATVGNAQVKKTGTSISMEFEGQGKGRPTRICGLDWRRLNAG